jgi:hypothetical protein
MSSSVPHDDDRPFIVLAETKPKIAAREEAVPVPFRHI